MTVRKAKIHCTPTDPSVPVWGGAISSLLFRAYLLVGMLPVGANFPRPQLGNVYLQTAVDDVAEDKDADEIRDRHRQDHHVAEFEDIDGTDDRAQEREGQEQHLVGHRCPLAEEGHKAAFAVVGP